MALILILTLKFDDTPKWKGKDILSTDDFALDISKGQSKHMQKLSIKGIILPEWRHGTPKQLQ